MERKYTNHQIDIDQNAWVYMYSDGFYDQRWISQNGFFWHGKI